MQPQGAIVMRSESAGEKGTDAVGDLDQEDAANVEPKPHGEQEHRAEPGQYYVMDSENIIVQIVHAFLKVAKNKQMSDDSVTRQAPGGAG